MHDVVQSGGVELTGVAYRIDPSEVVRNTLAIARSELARGPLSGWALAASLRPLMSASQDLLAGTGRAPSIAVIILWISAVASRSLIPGMSTAE